MKKTIINLGVLLISLALSNKTIAQSSVWATVENLETLQKEELFQVFVDDLKIEYEQALRSSKQEHLQKVYEFKCDCDGVDLYTSMHKLKSVSGIEYGPVYESLTEPNDYSTYNNNNLQLSSAWHLDLIGAKTAWKFGQGNDINIAISDQNYWAHPDNMHEELEGSITYYDETNSASQGHGTAVAITAAGNTDNGVGLSSIGRDATLSLYRMNYNEVLNASYSGARIVNLSWTSGCQDNPYIQDAITEVYENGTFIIASAGNGSTCNSPEALVYPAAHDNVFAVSSVDHNDKHEQSNSNTHQHNLSVDIMAPGYNVPISAAPGWYLFGSGTSYASPIVAGTVALMISVNPDLTNEEIENILYETALNIDEINPDYVGLMGAGRLNASYAVSKVQRDLDMANNNYIEDYENIHIEPENNTVNINELTYGVDDEVIAYPNPSRDEVKLKWGNIKMVSINIYNSVSQIVKTYNLGNLIQDRLNLSMLESGSYTAILLDNEGNTYKKKIVIH